MAVVGGRTVAAIVRNHATYNTEWQAEFAALPADPHEAMLNLMDAVR